MKKGVGLDCISKCVEIKLTGTLSDVNWVKYSFPSNVSVKKRRGKQLMKFIVSRRTKKCVRFISTSRKVASIGFRFKHSVGPLFLTHIFALF
jgi:hypothetical protein